AAESRDGACAAGFLVGSLAALMARPGTGDRTIVWIGTADKSREAGEIYPPGLAALGLDPKRIIRIATPRTADALWTFEAALACRGVVFAVCEVRGQTGYQTGYQTSHRAGHRARGLDLTATRRLALRAQASGATGFLLRFAETPEPTAAATRLLIAPAPSSVDPAHAGGFGPNPGRNLGRNLGGNWGGRPAWRVSLEKARFGRPGTIDLEWNAAGQCFAERKGEHEQADDRDDSAGRRAADGIAGDGGAGTRPRPDADHVRMAAEPSDRPADPDRQSAA
ncbi:MAG TPA: hypothetical protein VKN63_10845, partial [Afifellaceae bacterium]|nr:hypothetical protein [Afifellaceae bacterium]